MSNSHSGLSALFLTMLLTPGLMAQAVPAVPASVVEPPLAATPAEPQDPTPGAVSGEEDAPASRRPGTVAADAVVGDPNPANDHGDVYFTSPAPYTTAGILMQAKTAWPDIAVRVGASGAGSSFSVFNSIDQPVFRVTGYGLAGIGAASPSALLDIERNHDNGTTIELNNANSGSSSTNAWTGVKFMEGSTLKAAINSLGSASVLNPGGPGAFQLWNYSATPIIFGTSGTERMRLDAVGNVGIGITNPTRKLVVLSQTNGVAALFAQASSTYPGNATAYETAATGLSYQNISAGATNSGSALGQRAAVVLTGAGTLATAYGLQSDVSVDAGQTGTINSAIGLYTKVSRNQGTIATGYGIYVGNVEATAGWGIFQGADDDTNYFAGRILVGTTSSPTGAKLEVIGNTNLTGNLT